MQIQEVQIQAMQVQAVQVQEVQIREVQIQEVQSQALQIQAVQIQAPPIQAEQIQAWRMRAPADEKKTGGHRSRTCIDRTDAQRDSGRYREPQDPMPGIPRHTGYTPVYPV
jgi:hypothetical protein